MTYDLSQHVLVQDYRFGNARPDATIKTKSDLDLAASPRYIYGGYNQTAGATGNGCDGLYGNYWAHHIDTPEGDPASVHVFSSDHLTLKAYNNPNTPAGQVEGRDGGGILSGMLRFWAPIVPNHSFIRGRFWMPKGKWSWPAFWLNPGHEAYAPLSGPRGAVLQPLGWPPECDLHDGFGYDNTLPGTYLRPGEPTDNSDAQFGRSVIWDNGPWAENPGYDYLPPGAAPGWLAAGWHELALDWTNGVLTYYCDGTAYTQRKLTWSSPASACAHLIISNQVVAWFNPNPYPAGVPDQGGAGPGGWDFKVSDVQVYRRVAGVAPNPGGLSPAPGTVMDTTVWAPLPPAPPAPAVLLTNYTVPSTMTPGAVDPSTYAGAPYAQPSTPAPNPTPSPAPAPVTPPSTTEAQMTQTLFDGNLGPNPANLALKPGTMQMIKLTTAWANTSGAYDLTTGFYTVAAAGVYQVTGSLRVADGSPANISYGVGVGGASADDEGFHWNMTHPAAALGGSSRNGAIATRCCHFGKGETLRLYAFADQPLSITAASLQVMVLALD